MYTGDKTVRYTLRVNPEQADYIKSSAEFFHISPSDFLRMLVNLAMSGDKLADIIFPKEGGQRRENEKSDIDDKL